MKKFLYLFFALGICFLISCNKGEKEKDVTVILDWSVNTNHLGLYVAKDLGYFKGAGLNVKMVQANGNSVEQLVANGKGNFGISFQDIFTVADSNGLDLKAIAAILQDNTSGFMSLKEKNITRPRDFENKVYGAWSAADFDKKVIGSLMEADGGDKTKLKVVTTDVGFLSNSKNVDFAWVYEGWTLIKTNLSGIPVNYFSLKNYSEDLNYYTPILITSQSYIDNNYDTVKAFVQATKKGYEYAASNPEAAAKILLKYAPELDEMLVTESSKFLSHEFIKYGNIWGHMDENRWKNFSDWLFKNELLEKEFDYKKAYTNEFLE